MDCDSQGNATTGMGIDKPSLEHSIYDGLIEEADVDQIIITTAVKGLKMMPSDIDLIGFEVEMVSAEDRQKKLKNLLDQVADQFDYHFY